MRVTIANLTQVEFILQDVYSLAETTTQNSYYSGTFNVLPVEGTSLFVVGPSSTWVTGSGVYGAVYLTIRQPVRVQVTQVSGGNIINFNQITQSKGLNSNQANTAVSFTSVTGSGTGATFVVGVNGGTKLTTVNSVSNPGSGYQVGDILQFTPATPFVSSTGGLDSNWDLLLHGMAQAGSGGSNKGLAPVTGGSAGGGFGAPGPPGFNFGGSGGGGGSASGALLPTGSIPNPGSNGPPGGSGWGGGSQAQQGQNSGQPGGGGSGFVPVNTTYITSGVAQSIIYASQSIRVTIDGVVQTPNVTSTPRLFPLY